MSFLSAMQLPRWLIVAAAVATSAGVMVATSGLARNAARLVVDESTSFYWASPNGSYSMPDAIRPLIGACCAPGHHGYQRAFELISGQASNGPFGSPVFACAGKTDPPSSSHPLADLGG
jgi:hypothetical protein